MARRVYKPEHPITMERFKIIRELQEKESDANLLQAHVLELQKENTQVMRMAKNGNIMKFDDNEVELNLNER